MAKFIPNWNCHYLVSQETLLIQSETPPTAIIAVGGAWGGAGRGLGPPLILAGTDSLLTCKSVSDFSQKSSPELSVVTRLLSVPRFTLCCLAE